MRSFVKSKKPNLERGCLGFLLVSLLLMLPGCAQNHLSTETFPQGDSLSLRRIAVFPLQKFDSDEAVDNAVRCQICGSVVTLGSLEPQAETVVEEVLLQRLEKEGKYEIVPPERVQGVFQRLSANSLKAPLKDLLIRSGRELGADAIMYGQVYRFRERKGTAYGVDQAASVAFTMHLISTRDGSLLWKGRFDKTQVSLMENVFQFSAFYQERGRWLTARELADEGMAAMLKTFPAGP